jgi:hypothetical protein
VSAVDKQNTGFDSDKRHFFSHYSNFSFSFDFTRAQSAEENNSIKQTRAAIDIPIFALESENLTTHWQRSNTQ